MKRMKKIVALLLSAIMLFSMTTTAFAAEPYQNELEAIMDTSPADSGQVTHYDTATGEVLVEDGELLAFDEVAIPIPKGKATATACGWHSSLRRRKIFMKP